MRRIIVIASALLLAGCMEPVAIMGPPGFQLHGSADIELTGATFTATDGKLTCTGKADSVITTEKRVPITGSVTCDDGRKGIVIADSDSGIGHVRLTDDTVADFLIGPAANDAPAQAQTSPAATP